MTDVLADFWKWHHRTYCCIREENQGACWNLADSWWIGACVHEHVTYDLGVCNEHVWRMTRKWLCSVCDHECAVLMTKGCFMGVEFMMEHRFHQELIDDE